MPDKFRAFATIVVLTAICSVATTARAQQTINLPAGADPIWHGTVPNERAGSSLAQGSVGGNDARLDLIVGAPGSGWLRSPCGELGPCPPPTTSGRVNIVYGGSMPTGTLPLTASDAVIWGGNLGDRFGAATSAGNILNRVGSSAQNLLVGAPGVLFDGRVSRGAVYLFVGNFSKGDALTTSDAVLTIVGNGTHDSLGTSLLTADLNNDGYQDIVMGATGALYVIYGSASLSGTIDLSTTPADVTITGLGLEFPIAAAGDVTGDGVDDLVLRGSNAVYFVYGVSSGTLPAAISLPTGANALFLGADPGDAAGSSVRLADVDGDGWRDIVVGASGGDGPDNTRPDAGEVYLIWGTGSVIQSMSLSEAPVTFFGSTAHSGLFGITSGNVDGDAREDLVLNSQTNQRCCDVWNQLDIYYGRDRTSIGVVQPDGRRFVDFSIAGQADRRIVADPTVTSFSSAEVVDVRDEGTGDIVVSSPYADTAGGAATGYVYVVTFPVLRVSTQSLNLVAMQGTSATGYFEVSDPSSVEVTWEATDDQPWLTYTPTVGSAVKTNSAGVYLTAFTNGLAPGSYVATISVASTSPVVEMSLPVTVTFNVFSQPTLTLNSSSPGAIGAPITFNASISGGTGSFEYQFWRYKAGAGWTMGRAYDASPSWTWTPGAGDAGDYIVQVWVRTPGSTAAYEAWAAGEPFTISSLPRITAVTSDVEFPVATGTPITWTVQTSAGIVPLQYKFWRYSAATGWTMARDWAASNTHTWTPGPADTGTYQLQAWVRNAGGIGNPDAWSAVSFTVSNAEPIQGRSLIADRAFPAGTGTPITWTARASGGTAGPLQYKFWRYRLGTGLWTVVQDYSASSAWTWTPGYDDADTYVLQVWVRSAGSSASYETYMASEPWTITRSPVTISSLNTNAGSPRPSGTSVTWTTLASGGSGALEYQFWLYNATTGTWLLAQSYGSSNTFTWTTGSAATYWVQVWVRTVGSGVTQEAWMSSASLVVQ